MFSTLLIIDADWTASGWEIELRFSAEDRENGWADVTDRELPAIVGPAVAAALIREREASPA